MKSEMKFWLTTKQSKEFGAWISTQPKLSFTRSFCDYQEPSYEWNVEAAPWMMEHVIIAIISLQGPEEGNGEQYDMPPTGIE